MVKFCLDRMRCAHRCIGFPISMETSTDSEARNASVEPNSYQPPQQCSSAAQRAAARGRETPPRAIHVSGQSNPRDGLGPSGA